MKIKKSIILLILIFLILPFGSIASSDNGVYVVPIKGEINKATYNYLRDTMDKLNKINPELIIFEIDTYGGLIEEATKIKDLIISTNIPTISYVNNKAESAGVLIAISSEKLAMTPTSTIGSAETIPNTEKVLSLWRSFLRDTAQYRGKNPEIIEAMADKDIYIENITEKGKLLNLTSKEALKYEVADLVAKDYNDILAYFNIKSKNIIVQNEGLQIKLAKHVSSPYVSSLLLTLGFIGLIIEILTPGFGLGGTISIIGFGLYFAGNILSGSSDWTSLALFTTGLILLVIESIVPGFGLPGISGILMVTIGIVIAMESISIAILSLSIAIIITTIVTIILLKLGFKSKLLNKVILNANHKTEKGFISVSSKNEYLNKEGITKTDLRPTGFIEIDDKILDALSESGFISKDTKVKVVRVEGSKIFVRGL